MKSSLLLLACLIFISGCSRLDVAINWADTVVLSRVEDYYDLSSQQKKAFKKEFKIVFAEVRQQDFPLFAKFLDSISDSVKKNDLSIVSIRKHFQASREIFIGAMARFEPLIQRMNDEQAQSGFENFDREFLKKYKEDLEELQSTKKEAKKLRKQYYRFIDQTIESLSDLQKKSLDQQLSENPPPKRLQLESRKSLHDNFSLIRSDKTQRKEFLTGFVKNWESLQTAEYLSARKAYQEKLILWVYELSQSLSEKQKQKIIKNLNELSLELIQLSKQK